MPRPKHTKKKLEDQQQRRNQNHQDLTRVCQDLEQLALMMQPQKKNQDQ